MIELVDDNEMGVQRIPYTIPFITGIWHNKLSLDLTENPGLFEYLVSIPIETIIEKGKMRNSQVMEEIEEELGKKVPFIIQNINGMEQVSAYILETNISKIHLKHQFLKALAE